jgi:hypothetical protein
MEDITGIHGMLMIPIDLQLLLVVTILHQQLCQENVL